MSQRIQIRRGTAAEWNAANPILASGEQGLETDTNLIKFGDGATAWTSLPYLQGGSSADTGPVVPLYTLSTDYTIGSPVNTRPNVFEVPRSLVLAPGGAGPTKVSFDPYGFGDLLGPRIDYMQLGVTKVMGTDGSIPPQASSRGVFEAIGPFVLAGSDSTIPWTLKGAAVPWLTMPPELNGGQVNSYWMLNEPGWYSISMYLQFA